MATRSARRRAKFARDNARRLAKAASARPRPEIDPNPVLKVSTDSSSEPDPNVVGDSVTGAMVTGDGGEDYADTLYAAGEIDDPATPVISGVLEEAVVFITPAGVAELLDRLELSQVPRLTPSESGQLSDVIDQLAEVAKVVEAAAEEDLFSPEDLGGGTEPATTEAIPSGDDSILDLIAAAAADDDWDPDDEYPEPRLLPPRVEPPARSRWRFWFMGPRRR